MSDMDRPQPPVSDGEKATDSLAGQPGAIAPPRPPAPYIMPPQPPQPPKRRSRLRSVLTYLFGLLFLVSVAMNIYLLVIVSLLSGPGLSESVLRDGSSEQVVAVYNVDGVINGESASQFQHFYRIICKDDNVKAVVVRVNSPGGGVSTSDQIYRMVRSLREDYSKSVVISMGGVAASGGYYISAPADQIYAEPTTMTASIGVIMPLPIIKGFLDRHGVDVVMIRSRQAQRWKAAVNYFETPTPEILRERQKALDEMHERFAKVVRDGRVGKLKTTVVKVTVKDLDGKDVVREQIFPLNGRVLMAKEAKEVGLIDKIGYLDNAIDAAARLASLSKPKVVRYAKKKTLLESAGFSDMPAGIDVQSVEKLLTPRMMMLWSGC